MPFRITVLLNYFFKEAGQYSPTAIISSLILAIISFFYIFSFGSYFRITVYFLLHGFVYETSFQKYVISKDVDHVIIAIATVVWILMSLNGKSRLIISTVYGSTTAVAIVLSLEAFLEIAALLSFPLIVSLLLALNLEIRGDLQL